MKVSNRLREIADELDDLSLAECSGDITSECQFKPQQLTLSTGRWWYLEIFHEGKSIASQCISHGDWKCKDGYEIIGDKALFRIKQKDC